MIFPGENPPRNTLSYMKLNKKKLIIGLTGSFGTGKTLVGRTFKSLGACVIDADKIARDCLKLNTKINRKIIKIFGKGLLNRDKSINRKKLADIVFNNRKLLKELNNLVHPQVIRLMKKAIKACKKNVVILDAPLLVETNLINMVDKLIVVKSSRRNQIERIKKKLGLEKSDILKRIKSQISLSDKVRLADFVIDNTGQVCATKKQVREIWRRFN